MTTVMASERVQRRINDFQRKCGEYEDAALHLAYHACVASGIGCEVATLAPNQLFPGSTGTIALPG